MATGALVFVPLQRAVAAPTAPASAKRIAFASNRDGNFEIYTMDSNGQDVRRLTNSVGDDQQPAWNRDHSKLAFSSNRDGNFEIYVLNVVDGQIVGQAKRITNNPARDSAPAWSPNSDQIVFESNRDNPQESALYIANFGTRDSRRLTNRPGFLDSSPAWSPKGNNIVFQSRESNLDGRFREGAPSYIYTTDSSGENLKRVTGAPVTPEWRNDANPSWHPNGETLIFTQLGDHLNIVSLNPTSGEVLLLTPKNQDAGFNPIYSPDARYIVCVIGVAEGQYENAFTNTEIFILDCADLQKAPLRLTTLSPEDKDPSW